MTFPTFITNAFYCTERVRGAIDAFLGAIRQPTVFAGDNLITFGKSLRFLQPGPFRAAFDAARPEPAEAALVWRNHLMCWAARLALGVPGDFVEAACYKGFSARVVVNFLSFENQPRTFWLYDVFDGLPAPPDATTTLRALPEHGPGLFERVTNRFADCRNVRVVKGALPDALAEGPDQVAFLHLDMNDAAAEIATLDRLWDRISPGGMVLLDDFGWATYADQTQRQAEWFESRGLAIAELPTGQGLVVKSARS